MSLTLPSNPWMPWHSDGCGGVRMLASLCPGVDHRPRVLGWLASGMPIIPRAKWEEFDAPTADVVIKDQGSTNSCVGHAWASAVELAFRTAGSPHTKLSPWYVYSQINNGRDMGAIISDGADVVRAGVAPDASVPQGTWRARQIPDGAKQLAPRYRVAEVYVAETWDAFVSAVLLGFYSPFGLAVGARFNDLDQDGVATTGGMPNHAVCGGGGLKQARRGWAVKVRNSWGTRWGLNGFFWVVESAWSRWADAVVIRAVLDPPDQSPPPVPQGAA